MRNSFLYKVITLFLILLNLSCSDEKNSYEYEQVKLIDDDGTVSYVVVESYPVIGAIVSEAPQFQVTGVYRFSKGEVDAPVSSTFSESQFSVDRETGVIEYNNNGDLSPGDYFVSVNLENTNGRATYNQVYNLKINPVPVTLQVDSADVNVGFFDTGVIAMVSYTDTSSSGIITSLSYSLTNAPAGFSINTTTGEISKSINAVSGLNPISVVATTNVGTVLFTNIINVTVGDPPTLTYNQQNGTTNLNQVVLSPWTTYTTSVPMLEGMNAVSYTIVLPNTLAAGSATVNPNGSIFVSADQNLPVGTHSIGVIATNSSGIPVTFNDVFDLIVEFRWETTDLFNDTFNDAMNHQVNLNSGNTAYPEYTGYTIGAADTKWQKIILTPVEGLRIFNPELSDNYLVRSIDITNTKALKISFSELFGYNDDFITKYERALYVGESTTDLDGGTFNPSNWSVIMDNSDDRWITTSAWSTKQVAPVNDIVVNLDIITGNTLKLAWYLGLLTTPQNGQYFIDNINAQIAIAFLAEEG